MHQADSLRTIAVTPRGADPGLDVALQQGFLARVARTAHHGEFGVELVCPFAEPLDCRAGRAFRVARLCREPGLICGKIGCDGRRVRLQPRDLGCSKILIIVGAMRLIAGRIRTDAGLAIEVRRSKRDRKNNARQVLAAVARRTVPVRTNTFKVDRTALSKLELLKVGDPPIGQRLGDVQSRHAVRAGQVGDGACHFQHAMIAARGQAHAVGGIAQQLFAGRVGCCNLVKQFAFGLRVDAQTLSFETVALDVAGQRDSRGNRGVSLSRRRPGEVGCRNYRTFDVDVAES